VGNVVELCDDLDNALQYAPDLLTYERNKRRVLSDVYTELASSQPWPWLYKTDPLYALPDVALTNAQIALVGPRTFDINAAVLEDTFYSSDDTDAYDVFQDLLCGAELGLEDRTLREGGVGNWAFAPFVIENVDTSSASNVRIYLDPRCNITSLHSSLGDYVIRFPRARLPARCDRVIGITDDEDRPLTNMSDSLFRQYIADPDLTGSIPTHWLPDTGVHSGLPWLMGHTGVPGAVTGANESVRDTKNQPIYESPPFVAAAANTGANALLAETTYRLAICWVYAGRYGPFSEVVEVTTTSTNKAINLTALPTQNNGAAGTDLVGDSGRRISIWIAEGDHGPWFEASLQQTAIDTTATIATRPTIATLPQALRRREEIYPGGPYQYIRLWPRTDATRKMKLTYLAKPTRLVSNVDEPELPEQFHKLLVSMTVVEMIRRFNAGSSILSMHEAMVAKGMRNLNNRYLPMIAGPLQKGLWGSVPANGPYSPFPTTFTRE
jgi:hypothetical protein